MRILMQFDNAQTEGVRGVKFHDPSKNVWGTDREFLETVKDAIDFYLNDKEIKGGSIIQEYDKYTGIVRFYIESNDE